MHLPPEVLWLLQEGFFGYVGTSNRKREPYVTPVVFVFDGRHIYFSTSKKARKLRNISENPRVALLIDVRDPSDLLNNRAVLIRGTARRVGVLEAVLRFRHLVRIRRMFHDKYPRYFEAYRRSRRLIPRSWRTTPFVQRIIIKLTIERFVYMRECFQESLRRVGDD